jgi:hypothetical protein
VGSQREQLEVQKPGKEQLVTLAKGSLQHEGGGRLRSRGG